MTPSKWQLTFREIVAAAIAIALTIFVVWDLVSIAKGGTPAQEKAFQLVSSIFGAVVGYYFGHIPAAQAQRSAEQSAAKAQSVIDGARGAVNDYVRRVTSVAVGPTGGGAPQAQQEFVRTVMGLSQELEGRLKELERS
ncbi:MAG TPA: hypothetical protein VE964_04500 [Myxococcales bacterium]|nr:hypothetical protein [Myxococcales bacterium]